MYTRKTVDEYEIQGYYDFGWETVNTELTRKEAKRSLREYMENEPIAHRVIKRRVKKGGV